MQKPGFMHIVFVVAVATGLLVFSCQSAHAYILPALGLLSSLLGPVAVFFIALLMILSWPARILWKKWRGRKK